MKLIVAILVTTAMAVYAQAQDRNSVVTAEQRVVEIISRDPAKVETYALSADSVCRSKMPMRQKTRKRLMC
jgi:hypothetical protein